MTHKYGHKIILSIINLSYQPYIYFIVNKNLKHLSCDKFGFKVVQSCIISNNCDYKIKQTLLANVFKLLPVLSNHKYGHNCVESCIETTDDELLNNSIKPLFIDQILFCVDVNVNVNNYVCYDDQDYTLPIDLKKSFIFNMLNVQNHNTILNFNKFGFGEYSHKLCIISFKHSSYQQKKRLIVYLCNPNISNKFNVLFGLIHHKYGNIVVDNIIKTLINCNDDLNMFDQFKKTLNKLFQITSKQHNKNSFVDNIIKTIEKQ